MADELSEALLPPTWIWRRQLDCGGTLRETPVNLTFCVSHDGTLPQLRILVPATMAPFWPSPVELTPALLGRPSLGNKPFVELRRETKNATSVVYEFFESKNDKPLPFKDFTDASTGLAFSIAYGTCFIVPLPSTPHDSLVDNPFCLDTSSGPLAGELLNEIQRFIDTIRSIPASKNLSWLLHALTPTHLVPAAVENAELRRLVATALPRLLSRLGVNNVCALRADNPGTGWIATPQEFEGESKNLATELLTGQHVGTIANSVFYVVRRISLLVHINYVLTALPGREKSHCWPILSVGNEVDDSPQDSSPSSDQSAKTSLQSHAFPIVHVGPQPLQAHPAFGGQLPAPPRGTKAGRQPRSVQSAQERAATLRALFRTP